MEDIVLVHGRYKDLHRTSSLGEKIQHLHQMIRQDCPYISRVAVALFDTKMNTLKTFVQSADNLPLQFYECLMENAPSLMEIKARKRSRVVNDMAVFRNGTHEHTKKIAANGYQASYSVPLFDSGTFIGMLFFNSYQKNVFKEQDLTKLDLFAPLHDIGKIGIPDNILLKPGKLDKDEWEIMQTHSIKGREIVDAIADHLGLQSFEHLSLLQSISGSHHETIDGKGYPNHLKDEEIPIETQIVSVADIFDALTSHRSYKPAWSIDMAFEELHRMSGTKLNPDCVRVLIENEPAVREIQKRFTDDLHHA